VGGTATAKTLTTSAAIYTAIKGSATYPAGNTDIGIDGVYAASSHIMTLNECGIVVAYTPSTTPSLSAWAEPVNQPFAHYRKYKLSDY
jgi:hypothetical protein